MQGKTIKGTDINGKEVRGKVELVYNDALASGTNEYVQITYLLVKFRDEATKHSVHVVRPRDVEKIY